MESEVDHPQPKRHKLTNRCPVSIMHFNILVRIPVKSVLRFTCVSKSWLALISTPEFVKTHLTMYANYYNKDTTNHRLMLKVDRTNYNLMDCSISSLFYDSVAPTAVDLGYPCKGYFNVLGSVNGLICFYVYEESLFVLWNPSIRKFKKFPDPRIGRHFMHGFGYDELHDEYKVVSIDIRVEVNNLGNEVNIYSLSSGTWTSYADVFTTGPSRRCLSEGKFVNGKLHWAINTSRDSHSLAVWDIIYIDLVDEEYGKVELPCYEDGYFDQTTMCVAVLGSDLCVVTMVCNGKQSCTDVWIMNEYGVKESWTKMFTINRPWTHNIMPMLVPLICMNKGEMLSHMYKKGGHNGNPFMIYNPKDKSIRYQRVTNCAVFSNAYIYIESLVWPFAQKEQRKLLRRMKILKRSDVTKTTRNCIANKKVVN